MFLSQFKESVDKELEIKDTNIESFKVFLKYCYFDELEAMFDYSLAIDVFRLSHKYQMKDLMNLIEELIELISIENNVDIYDFAIVYELNNLLSKLKIFINQNVDQVFNNELLSEEQIEKLAKFLKFSDLSPNHLIPIVTEIADNNLEKDLKLFLELIKFDLCSVKNLKELRIIV
jgi:hypothetical protein